MRQAAAGADPKTRRSTEPVHSVTGAGRNVDAEALAGFASALEETIGSLSDAEIDAAIAALQAESMRRWTAWGSMRGP